MNKMSKFDVSEIKTHLAKFKVYQYETKDLRNSAVLIPIGELAETLHFS